MFSDQILNTESINESLNNRQSAKILYLQKENEQLLQENEDLKDALKLNKEALRIAYIQSSSSSGTGNKIKGQKQDNFLDDFTIKITQESEKLLGMLTAMSKERSKAQSIALLQEQIAEENSNFFQEQIAEKDEKIKELRMLIQDKEYVIQEFEKAKGYYDYGQKVLVRIRDIISPNDQSVKFLNEIQNLKDIITKLSEENQQLNNKIQQKEEHSRVLKQEILKLRLVIMNPVNYQKMRGFLIKNDAEKGDEDAFMCGAFYKEAELQTQEEQNVILQKQQQQQLLQFQKELLEKQHTPLRPTRVAPSANNNNNFSTLPSQKYTGQYSGNIQIDKLNETVSKLEENLKKMNKLYRKEVENNNILVSKVEEILRECDTCFNNNELLIASNLQFQSQSEELKNQLAYFKKEQKKYFMYLRRRRHRFNSLEISANQQGQQNGTINQNQKGRESTAKSNINTNHTNNEDKEVNVSILEEDDVRKDSKEFQNQYQFNPRQIRYDLFNKRKQDSNNILQDLDGEEFTRNQAKIYLLNLAKDLYVNANIKSSGLSRQVLKQIEIGGYKTGIITLFRSKRSLSDPLDYIWKDSEMKYSLSNQYDLSEVFRKNRIQMLKNQQQQQQQAQEEREQKEGQGLFHVDMSVIVNIQPKLEKQKQKQKKIKKQQIDDVSFISNDGGIEQFD